MEATTAESVLVKSAEVCCHTEVEGRATKAVGEEAMEAKAVNKVTSCALETKAGKRRQQSQWRCKGLS